MTQVPVRDVFVDANGIRHHLVVRGSPGTPVVVMLHGLSGQAHVFDAIASKLAASHHVYCPDVRGRGETGWGPQAEYTFDVYNADFEAVRAALGLARFSIVGTSMGGVIGFHHAGAHPEQVEKLVINDVGPDVHMPGLLRIVAGFSSAPEAFADIRAAVRYMREAQPVMQSKSDDELHEYVRWHLRKNDLGLYVWKLDPAVRRAAGPAGVPMPDHWAAFNAITCPILLLRGAESDLLTPEIVARMREAQPGMEVVEVPGVGHAPTLSEPIAAKAVQSFLA